MKQMTIFDFLTEAEVEQAAKLCDRIAVRDQLIAPNMERINKALGQENDPDYLSFCVEYVMTRSGTW